MKIKPILLAITLLLFTIPSIRATPISRFSTSPPLKIEKKWRIGYYEGGLFIDYQIILKNMILRFMDLGWLAYADLPIPDNNEETSTYWRWLSTQAKSDYLEFPPNAYYTDGWDENKKWKTQKKMLNRLKNTNDIDLMIAMGTWAGKILATNAHDTPTVVCSSTDPIAAGIIGSAEDSGFDHVTSKVDPDRCKRNILAFHDLFGFKRLGMAFMNSVTGRSYASLEDVIEVSQIRDFEIIPCHTIDDVPDKQISNKSVISCANELAPKIDAFFMTVQNGINDYTLPVVVDVMNRHGIPTFSQFDSGSSVSKGILMGANNQFTLKEEGGFYADHIAGIINGIKPRDLNQLQSLPVTIAFNKETARRIDLDEETYQLLANVADNMFDNIEFSLVPTDVTPRKKWRIGYLEGGEYGAYVENLKSTIKALIRSGWMELNDLDKFENFQDTHSLWKYLANHSAGEYLSFSKNAFYSNGWDKAKRSHTKFELIKRLNSGKDIDMMIAMGTWAGLDLANELHSTPTVVFSSSDPLRAGIIKQADRSGYDHLVARIDPTRFPRQVEAFHDVVGFQKLGVIFSDNIVGRSYAGIEDIEKIASHRGFEVIKCFSSGDAPDDSEAERSAISCAEELAVKVDALYLTLQNGVTKKSVRKILEPFHNEGIPTFSQSRYDGVALGALMSLAAPTFKGWGEFQAELMGNIMNGAIPGELNGIREEAVKIAFNVNTAIRIGLSADQFNLLYESAEIIIEEDKKKE